MAGKVICVGAVVADLVAQAIPELPKAGASARTPSISLNIGGCAANVATGLARLGRAVQLCGAVGDDDLGKFLYRSLAEEGVSLDLFQVKPGERTGATFVINTEGEDRRFISDTAANDCGWPEALPEDSFEEVEVLSVHAFGLSRRPHRNDLLRWFPRAQAAGALTILDVIVIPGENLLPDLEAVLPHVDLFTPNEEEAVRLTGEADLERSLQRFIDLGTTTAVITRGDRGLIWQGPEGTGSIEAPSVQEMDATGCGDAFIAGFVDAHLEQRSTAEISTSEMMWRGALMGASVAQKPGAINGLPKRSELDLFDRSTPRPHSLREQISDH